MVAMLREDNILEVEHHSDAETAPGCDLATGFVGKGLELGPSASQLRAVRRLYDHVERVGMLGLVAGHEHPDGQNESRVTSRHRRCPHRVESSAKNVQLAVPARNDGIGQYDEIQVHRQRAYRGDGDRGIRCFRVLVGFGSAFGFAAKAPRTSSSGRLHVTSSARDRDLAASVTTTPGLAPCSRTAAR